MEKEGQSSLEYILLVGILLVLLIPLFYYATNKTSESIKVSQATDVVESLAKAADEVYVLGAGTKRFVWINVPGGVESASISSSEITLTIHVFGDTSDVVAATNAPLAGEIPIEKGTYKIPVEHLASGVVLIGEGNDSTPPAITWTYPSGFACNPVILRVTTDESARCKFDTDDNTYDAMATSMVGNALGHSYEFGVQNSGSYSYYVKCSDAFNNAMTNSSVVNYNVNLTLCAQQNGSVQTVEFDPPNVTLVAPSSGSVVNTTRISFDYNVTDASSISNCQLFTNDQLKATAYAPPKGVTTNITADLERGNYQWYVNCTDAYGNMGKSLIWSIQVNATLDNDLPVVKSISPLNGSIRNFNFIQFFYNVTDITSSIASCTLSMTSVFDSGGTSGLSVADYSVAEGSQQSIAVSLDKGNHTWNISCTDASIYANKGISENWWLRVNSTTQETFITSCAGACGYEGYSDGICRQEPPKCLQNNEVNLISADHYCTGGSQSDTCCCHP